MPDPVEPKIDARLPSAMSPLPAASGEHASRRMLALLGAATTAGFEAGAIGFVLPAMRESTGALAQLASWLLSVFVAATLVGVPLVVAGLGTAIEIALTLVCGLMLVCAPAVFKLPPHDKVIP